MEGPSPSLVVGIDVGMTCTDVAYTSADWKKPEVIQKWPGRKDLKSFFTKGKVFSMVWHEKSVTSTHRSRNFLPILVNGTRTNALPDTGSLANVITEEYASSQGVFIDRHPSKQQVFINAVGNTFKSVGQATVQLSFLDMPGKVFSEVFSVVSKCGTPLVLGDSFLQTQEILTRFRHRLKKIAVTAKQAWRLMHMDIPYQKFICRMDDQYVAVTVDTGSEKNYFSRNYAQRCCWDIKPLPSDGGFVELADGQIVKASGYIDKEISIGAYECKGRFYILDGLMCDALLGDETIEESDLYNDANIRNWVVSETSDIHSEFFAISWLDKIEDHVSEFLTTRATRFQIKCKISLTRSIDKTPHTYHHHPWENGDGGTQDEGPSQGSRNG